MSKVLLWMSIPVFAIALTCVVLYNLYGTYEQHLTYIGPDREPVEIVPLYVELTDEGVEPRAFTIIEGERVYLGWNASLEDLA